MLIPKFSLHEFEYLNIHIIRFGWNDFQIQTYVRAQPDVRKTHHIGLMAYLAFRIWMKLYRRDTAL